MLRGRRGHYEFADELRAYDLATGAAYVVRDTHRMIVTDPATQGPTHEAYTGTIAPDQLRELAFVLLTREAIVELRTRTAYAIVPDTLALTLTPGREYPRQWEWGRTTWSSSDQTHVAFSFVDGGQRKAGTFTWPSAWNWIDNHLVSLVEVAEAGLVRGCAPAKLPALAELRSDIGGVSAIDADRDDLLAQHAELERRLDALRGSACRGAR